MTTNPLPPARVEQAREFLAAEYDRDGWKPKVREMRDLGYQPSPDETRSLRAIEAAFQAGIAEGLERAAKVVEDYADTHVSKQTLWRLAAAIRALSEEGAAG